ncbi:hypothetical protein [Streptomyces sp. AC602_WCS936]|uniref:hypothetical protein n=1 Tax=Streptomyces sp. AC602_WCS936 TaxID=2823685 RepID=UPI001C2712DC|nr:hypothetical protein [Streptomyces sp. AC602_WCS936]
MTDWIHRALPHHEETNVVFFRGMTLDALTRGLLAQHRMPLAYGKGTDWGLLMHDMLSWEENDYDVVGYGPLSAGGGELVVFVTEPCSVKGHRPSFEYHRDGHLITAFSFEALSQPWGEQPDLLSPALMAARLTGPAADLDSTGNTLRTAQAITDFFALPDLAYDEVVAPGGTGGHGTSASSGSSVSSS